MKESRMIGRLKKWYNRNTNTWHYFVVKFTYKVGDRTVFDWSDYIGVSYKGLILDDREIKKSYAPLHLLEGVRQNLLDNGVLICQVQSYLGYFKKK